MLAPSLDANCFFFFHLSSALNSIIHHTQSKTNIEAETQKVRCHENEEICTPEKKKPYNESAKRLFDTYQHHIH